MKLFYIVFSRNDFPGVNKKILQQAKVLFDLGIDLELIIISSNKLVNLKERDWPWITKFDQWEDGNRLFRRKNKINLIDSEICKKLGNQKFLIYMRYTVPDYFLLRFIKKYSDFIITEHQTFETKEWFSNKNYVAFIFEVIFGRKIRSYLRAMVGVTKEICNYQLSKINRQVPSFVMPNGIDVSSTFLRKIPPWEQGGKLHLLCVAQVANWHGLDRLIWGMANSGNSNVYLHIVGDGPAIPQLKELVSHKDLEDQVIFHGFKTGEELDEMFDKCHIAVGSLGIHRKGLKETSDLKSREYCARGIPFFNSALDADFPVSFPFRLKTPEDDSPIDMEQVMYFAKNVLADREHPKKMREYAFSNLDWNIKMRKLKSFFEEVLKSR